MSTIILGYDDSSGAKAALEQALVLSKQFGDRLVIGYGAAPPGASMEGTEYKEHLRAIEELGRQATDGALARARSEGVDAEVALVPERPSQTLVDLAESTTHATSWSAATAKALSRVRSSARRHTSLCTCPRCLCS